MHRWPVAAAGAATLAYGWWATGLTPFSGGTAVAVVGAGAVAMAAGTIRRVRREQMPLAGSRSWFIAFAALAAWQVRTYRDTPRSEHPTLSSLTNAALDTHAPRALAFVAWIAAAWWMATR